jgi:hypothetical protein
LGFAKPSFQLVLLHYKIVDKITAKNAYNLKYPGVKIPNVKTRGKIKKIKNLFEVRT